MISRHIKLLMLLYLLNFTLVGVTAKGQSKSARKKKCIEKEYKAKVANAKKFPDCYGIDDDDMAYSCVTYKIGPECFREHIGTRGREFGQENFEQHQQYLQCLNTTGIIKC